MKVFRKTLSILLALLLAIGCIGVAYAADTVTEEVETNDTPDKATLFTVSGGAKGSVSERDDIDWFKVDLGTSMGLAIFKFAHPGSGSDALYYKVSVFASSDTDNAVRVFTVAGDKAATTADPILVSGGIYFVKIEAANANANYEYKLTVSLDANLKSETEDNNDKANADELVVPNNKTSEDYYGAVAYTESGTADKDWFKFSCPTGSFQIDFAALTPGIKYQIDAYTIPGDHYDPSLIARFYVTSADTTNADGYVNSAIVGVNAGTYFVVVSANNNGESASSKSDANYKLRVAATAGTNSEAEVNNAYSNANAIKLGSTIYGSLSYENDIDVFTITTKADDSKYKVTISGSETTNDDTASWEVSVLDSNKKPLDKYTSIIVNLKTPLVIDMNGLAAGTYYIKVSKVVYSKGDYSIKVESFTSDATPAAEGNFFQRIWARIKVLNWKDFWNNNFNDLILGLGGEDSVIDLSGDGNPDMNLGMFKTLFDVLKLSFGTIFKLFSN